jgi:hypothetical protein
MAITSPRKVTSGFFRNHSYVLLGLNVLATLAALADRKNLWLWPPIAGIVCSYLCAAVWLYEIPRLGRLLLWCVSLVSLVGSCLDQTVQPASSVSTNPGSVEFLSWIRHLDGPTGGLLLGATIAAMFLGHWYLNSPTMELAPLRKLLRLMACATLARAAVCLSALALMASQQIDLSTVETFMVVLRWTAGIIGTTVLTWMTWQTLKIPNTQSATGILYVAVVAVFIGELTSLLLSGSTGFPL